jgi:GTP cyclohydrolase II
MSLNVRSSQPMADATTQRLRQVHRAASELRRGVPVVLRGQPSLCLLAAELAGPDSLSELEALGSDPPVILLAPVRAAAVLRQPIDREAAAIAVALPDTLRAEATLRGLADPTMPPVGRQSLTTAPTPATSPAAIALAKLGRLLPAVLAVTARPDIDQEVVRRNLLTVEASDVLA